MSWNICEYWRTFCPSSTSSWPVTRTRTAATEAEAGWASSVRTRWATFANGKPCDASAHDECNTAQRRIRRSLRLLWAARQEISRKSVLQEIPTQTSPEGKGPLKTRDWATCPYLAGTHPER